MPVKRFSINVKLSETAKNTGEMGIQTFKGATKATPTFAIIAPVKHVRTC